MNAGASVPFPIVKDSSCSVSDISFRMTDNLEAILANEVIREMHPYNKMAPGRIQSSTLCEEWYMLIFGKIYTILGFLLLILRWNI